MHIIKRHERLRTSPGLAIATATLAGLMATSTIRANPGDHSAADRIPATPAIAAADAGAASDSGPSGSFSYLNISAQSFQPRDDGDGFRVGQPGCVHLTSGSKYMEHKVLLPDGAVVQYLRIFYYDTNGQDLAAWLTEYDGTGGFFDVTTVASNGTTGFGSALSPLVGRTVDHYTKALTIVVNPRPVFDGSLQFCGARIAYFEPIGLDRIFENGFD